MRDIMNLQGDVWLAKQPMLRTPVLCVKSSSDPIEVIFLKTFETVVLAVAFGFIEWSGARCNRCTPTCALFLQPQRDASGRGWHLVSKTKVHCKEGEFKSETIRLYPATSQTSDQQLDDVVAAIRE